MRTSTIFVALMATALGCGKKGADDKAAPAASMTDDKAAPAPSGSSATAPAPAAATAPGSAAAPAPAPAAGDGKVEHTGVLDFDLVQHDGKYTLRDGAYDITFAVKPDISGEDQVAPDGSKLHTATALAARGEDELAGFFVMPIPKGMPYNVKVGLDGARDQSIAKINGKISSEVETKFGSLAGLQDHGDRRRRRQTHAVRRVPRVRRQALRRGRRDPRSRSRS